MIESRDHAHDFDFFSGTWRVWNERLRRPFQNCTEWETFEQVREANEISRRTFDPLTGQWSLFRGDARLVGGFVDGIGIFEGRDAVEGRSVAVRCLWSEIRKDAAKLAQYFSADGGMTWEKNWVMYLTRVH